MSISEFEEKICNNCIKKNNCDGKIIINTNGEPVCVEDDD